MKTNKPKCITCKRRDRLKGRKECGSCLGKKWRAVDPVRSSYNNLKAHAKERNKVFTISLEYFRKFCYKYDYIAKKGKHAEGYAVDRIIEELGYIEGNIQALMNKDNVKKYLNYDWEHKIGTVQTVKLETENLPF